MVKNLYFNGDAAGGEVSFGHKIMVTDVPLPTMERWLLAVARQRNQGTSQISMPPPQNVWSHQDGEVAHVEFLGGVAEGREARQFSQAWCAAHSVRFLPRQVAHH
jgi:hypothetical protein